jgi:glutamate N-acetyltransferase/amino-acid N-acetyltransferase
MPLHLLSPAGFRASGVYAGIKSRHALDVGLLLAEAPAAAAACFTKNQVRSAAVCVGARHIAAGRLRGVVVNSGNANACTGRQGERDALRMCALAARIARCRPGEILPSSTGIIGHPLPMTKVERGIVEAGQYLGSSLEHAHLFADAILTTDLKRKMAAVTVKLGRERVTIAGVCKGSGMIGPRLGPPQATMLAYLTTDALIAPPLLRRLLLPAVDESFNCVTVDDHCSTNDTVAILASGASEARVGPGQAKAFATALAEVCRNLAYQIAADGEGATKVVSIAVRRARTPAEARVIARTIANSPLVKCAMHGNDPNWGRIVSAAGQAPARFDPDRAVLSLQGTKVFARGRPLAFDAAAVSKALAAAEVKVLLDCGLGSATSVCWTCDFSRQYVAINADYHT